MRPSPGQNVHGAGLMSGQSVLAASVSSPAPPPASSAFRASWEPVLHKLGATSPPLGTGRPLGPLEVGDNPWTGREAEGRRRKPPQRGPKSPRFPFGSREETLPRDAKKQKSGRKLLPPWGRHSRPPRAARSFLETRPSPPPAGLGTRRREVTRDPDRRRGPTLANGKLGAWPRALPSLARAQRAEVARQAERAAGFGSRAAAAAIMVRKLKFHEQKLLKQVDFLNWEVTDHNLHELRVLRRYRLQRREDYTRYNQLSRAVRELARRLRDLPERDPFRVRASAALLDKLYALGLVPTRGSLELCDSVTASSFCRRRLPTVLLKLRMAQHLQAAVAFVEQGHVRVGPDVVTDPAFLVTRSMEDFVTWVDSSKIKRHVLEYNEERDDFDLEA
uniref:U3 small nucleolar ribonucleoprotein protein IMP3 n=2 Tax=Oryctolagus cuniculus TaxID=9986 RepID=G1SMB3_RABIT